VSWNWIDLGIDVDADEPSPKLGNYLLDSPKSQADDCSGGGAS
jgi:hypothetical protein